MIMSDLPPDLVKEILSRVPATSLKRLRSTCKQWNALFKDQRFTENHFFKASKQSLVLMLKEYRICPMSINLNVTPPSLEFKSALSLKDTDSNLEQVDIAEVFHCDGLLLCITKNNRVVVWNPCLGETRWIQLKTGYKRFSKFALGHEKTKSCRNYKILRYWDCEKPNHSSVFGLEIYEFSSDSWRVLDEVTLNCIILPNGLSLNGNTYWLATDRRDKYKFLLSFDFTRERFKRLSLPQFQDRGFMDISVVKEEHISVLKQSFGSSKMEIWVTNNKIDDSEDTLLWSKSFSIRICFLVFSSHLIDEEKKLVLCSETRRNNVYMIGEDDEYYAETSYIESTSETWFLDNIFGESTDKTWWPFIFSYVPSLVQIQQGTEKGKSKEKN